MALHLMLDLGDAVRIGDGIFVTYTRRNGRRALLSFDAPREIPIERLTTPAGRGEPVGPSGDRPGGG